MIIIKWPSCYNSVKGNTWSVILQDYIARSNEQMLYYGSVSLALGLIYHSDGRRHLNIIYKCLHDYYFYLINHLLGVKFTNISTRKVKLTSSIF